MQLDALGAETRRDIYTMLAAYPRAVGDLAAELPVSRPAVSQHLKVLLDAGLVSVTKVGTRNIYAADPEGVKELRQWIDGLWEAALASFAEFARREHEKGTRN